MTDIIVSPAETRKFRYIKLDNGLRALLIQDEATTKSAAALDVNVGSGLDPKDRPGLAHFCEHMLFMGTEKYPDENEYSEFISNNGGYNNAWTSLTSTNYQFEVSVEAFKETLDRFAQFFICPLFNKDSVDREMNAVDSENKKNLQNDMWR